MSEQGDALRDISASLAGVDYQSSLGDCVYSGLSKISKSITADVCGGPDATGGHVESLTEAVMGLTHAMTKIADAIEKVAEALETRA